jgi:hypothetical protein
MSARESRVSHEPQPGSGHRLLELVSAWLCTPPTFQQQPLNKPFRLFTIEVIQAPQVVRYTPQAQLWIGDSAEDVRAGPQYLLLSTTC